MAGKKLHFDRVVQPHGVACDVTPNYFCCSSFSGVDGGDIIGNHLTSACGVDE